MSPAMMRWTIGLAEALTIGWVADHYDAPKWASAAISLVAFHLLMIQSAAVELLRKVEKKEGIDP